MTNSQSGGRIRPETRNKILLVGLANAGKTSIYIRCFENADHDRIRNLSPTILFTSKKPKMNFSEEFIEFMDLGGQKQYIKHHLANPSTFRNLRTVIFVVDVQDISNFEELKLYVSEVLKRIRDNEETPMMAVFLHKADPKQRADLQENVVYLIKELRPLFSSDIVFHPTSIFDESVYEAMIHTLFWSLPKSVIKQTITKDVLFTAHKTLLPMFKTIHATPTPNGDLSKKQQTLLAFSVPFGNALAKKLKDKWIQCIIAPDPDPTDSFSSDKDLSVEIKPDGLNLDVICPVLSDLGGEPNPLYCDITKGVLEGLATLIGFDCVIQTQTQIRDNAPKCTFQLRRKRF